MEDFEIIYPIKNSPCWFCSKLFGRITIGKNKGKLIAAVGLVDGHERTGHARCFRKSIDEDDWNLVKGIEKVERYVD